MFLLKRTLSLHVYLTAGFLAAAVPMSVGYLIFKSNPAACYDSPCALPLLFVTVPMYAAPVLTVLFALNRRFQRPIPDGWMPTVLISACIGQVAISVFSILLASGNVRRNFYSDILFVPQGFIIGALVASVFWAASYLLGRETNKP